MRSDFWERMQKRRLIENAAMREWKALRDPHHHHSIRWEYLGANQRTGRAEYGDTYMLKITATNDRDRATALGWEPDYAEGQFSVFSRARPCAYCKTNFWRKDGRFNFCSYLCRAESTLATAKGRRATKKVVAKASCDHCGENFTPARSDAKFCLGSSRVAAHRAKE